VRSLEFFGVSIKSKTCTLESSLVQSWTPRSDLILTGRDLFKRIAQKRRWSDRAVRSRAGRQARARYGAAGRHTGALVQARSPPQSTLLDDCAQEDYSKSTMPSVLASSRAYSLSALEADVVEARRVLDFGAGAYEHSISLPAEDEVHAEHRAHRNNVPFADALPRCRYLRDLFHGFRADKASFRLLLRRAGTAYSLHDDRDAGGNIVRMQLPVITNGSALLLVQKAGADMGAVGRRVADTGNGSAPIMFDYQRFRETFGEWFNAFFLEPGRFYLIDTDLVHTLINAGNADRVTLSIDLIRNPWLDRWLADNMTKETSPLPLDELPEGRWEWGALRHGVLCHP